MLSACVLRPIARGAPRRCPSLLSRRVLTARSFASTGSILQKIGPKKAPATVLGRKGTVSAVAALKPDQKPALLAEAELTTHEQRKADWGIIKEMSRYLWPKVGGPSLHLTHTEENVELRTERRAN